MKSFTLYEVETIFYTPGKTNRQTHVRDTANLKRIMIFVWMFTFQRCWWACITGFLLECLMKAMLCHPYGKLVCLKCLKHAE